jgi:nitrite reductase/ring-hydroxylating ferredoxin subunit
MGGWRKVMAADDVREGSPRGVVVDDVKIGLFRIDNEIHAINDVCTHAFALLSNGFQEGCLIECPLHSGFFDVRTGKAQGPPVEEDVARYPVRVTDGWVYVEIP